MKVDSPHDPCFSRWSRTLDRLLPVRLADSGRLGLLLAALVADEGASIRLSRHSHERGYSLVELLIVVMMIGTVSMIAVPEYMDALDKARVARAIGDIAAISREISAFAVNEARYPADLSEVGRDDYLDPFGNPYEYLRIDQSGVAGGGPPKGGGGGVMAAARKDKFLVPLNADFDLYSRGKDGLTKAPLTAPQSLDDIVRANDGGFIGLGSEY